MRLEKGRASKMFWLRRKYKTTSANIITEYALVLGLVGLILMAMSTYVKRGIQGRVKDITDTFISARQVGRTDDEVTSSTNTTSVVDNITRNRGEEGGLTNVVTDENINSVVESNSSSVVSTYLFPAGLLPAAYQVWESIADPDGQVESSDYTDDSWKYIKDIKELEQIRDSYIEEALGLRGAGDLMQQVGQIVGQAPDMVGQASAGTQDIPELELLIEQGQEGFNQPGEFGSRYDNLIILIGQIQDRIDCLTLSPDGPC